MKQHRNSERGVSLMQLIVAIIIMIIITSFSLWYASNTSTEAKLTRVYSEIKSVKEAYQNAVVLNEIAGNDDEKKYHLTPTTLTELTNEYGEDDIPFLHNDMDLYIVTPENAKDLEIERLSMDYVIDGKTGSVYLIGGFSRNPREDPVYEADHIMKLYKSTFN